MDGAADSLSLDSPSLSEPGSFVPCHMSVIGHGTAVRHGLNVRR